MTELIFCSLVSLGHHNSGVAMTSSTHITDLYSSALSSSSMLPASAPSYLVLLTSLPLLLLVPPLAFYSPLLLLVHPTLFCSPLLLLVPPPSPPLLLVPPTSTYSPLLLPLTSPPPPLDTLYQYHLPVPPPPSPPLTPPSPPHHPYHHHLHHPICSTYYFQLIWLTRK